MDNDVIPPSDGPGYHTILVAICVQAPSRERAEKDLYNFLPVPEREQPGYPMVDSWWVAEDVRYDRSDNDSAVFCAMGKQQEARDLIVANGLHQGPTS